MAQEKIFENRVKKFLNEIGCWHVKYFANGMTRSGIPDILCCCGGRFVGVEVKADNGKPSPLQIYNLNKIHDAGGFGILLYPKDFERFTDCMYDVQQIGNSSEYKYFREVVKKYEGIT